jgi:hypothetical protein
MGGRWEKDGEKMGEGRSIVALRRRLGLRVWDYIKLHYTTLYHKRNERDRMGQGKQLKGIEGDRGWRELLNQRVESNCIQLSFFFLKILVYSGLLSSRMEVE